jgi:4-amino-4-deoxy-L-arabinose transferase-like glycosyltransferase
MGKPQLKMWVWVLAALVAGLALRLYFVLEVPRIAGDTLMYGDIAKNLIERHVYGFTVAGGPPRPTLIRVPGYPLFLAACFRVLGMERYQSVLYVQVAIDLLSCALVGDLARRLFGPRAGLAGLWLAVLCPFTANYVSAALTETLSLFCIVAAFYGLVRWREAGLGFHRWLWVIAAALAYAVLLRPEQGLLAAAVVPAMLWLAWGAAGNGQSGRFKALVPVAAAAVCVVLPLVPWAIRNERTFHVFQPLAPRFANDPNERVPLGFQRWYRTWAIEFASTESVYWNYDGDDINIADLPNRAFDTDSQYERTEQILAQYDLTDRATADLDRRFNELAQERIDDDPIRYYVALPVARVADMLLRPRTEMMEIPLEWWKWKEHREQTAFAAVYGALSLGYFVLGVAGLIRWRSGVVCWAMVAYVVLRCALLLTLDNSEPRYTLEFFPLLFVWGAGLFRSGE